MNALLSVSDLPAGYTGSLVSENSLRCCTLRQPFLYVCYTAIKSSKGVAQGYTGEMRRLRCDDIAVSQGMRHLCRDPRA